MPRVRKTVEEEYEIKDEIEHALDLPDTFIGSIKPSEQELYILDKENKLIKKTIEIIPGLYKIYDEVIVNAFDHEIRMRTTEKASGKDLVTEIGIKINKETNEISVRNNGKGIPVKIHDGVKVYVPQMIFGMMRTSSNYAKDEKRFTGGKNGYGVKLCNIFSTKFVIETGDAENRLKYIQEWTNNMRTTGEPKIEKFTGKPYTQVTFIPDFNVFKCDGLSDDMIALFKKRAYDVSALTPPNVKVYLDDTLIKIKDFNKYCDLFKTSKKIHTQPSELWDLAVGLSDDCKFDSISYVNGIYTSAGGTHVDYVAKLITTKLQKWAQDNGVKRQKVKIKQEFIKDNLWIMLRATVVNPAFTSQSKEYMTTPYKEFGFNLSIDDAIIEKLAKMGILEKALAFTEFKSGALLEKTSGKQVRTLNIPKLDDANHAGKKDKSSQCTLILTEGDSAKALAISGLSVIGRDYYGVYPLRGKIKNVRNTKESKIADSQIIETLVKIMGLNYKLKYETNEEYKTLRYGHIMIFTDQDLDGFHIKGLIMNWIHYFWPNLLKRRDFVSSLPTKIIEAKLGKDVLPFYTIRAYKDWTETIEPSKLKKYSIKYYKGLGTSTAVEAKEYFKEYNKNLIHYFIEDDKDNDSIKMAFDDSRSDDRKSLVINIDPHEVLDATDKKVNLSSFVKKELAHFSNYDCERSIPNIMDGQKTTQRKVLWAFIKRNVTKEIKVVQASGLVMQETNYHHGDMSLNKTIIGLAQNYVGSNNINILTPSGQFGTRLVGGADHASPRYIFTCLESIVSKIFIPVDNNLLTFKDDDGMLVEPEYFVPIIPMILVNGVVGIGSGYSSTIPSYNPLDLIKSIKILLDDPNADLPDLTPYYRNFTGKIVKDNKSEKFIILGLYNRRKNIININELPVGVWTSDYEEYLMSLETEGENKGKKTKRILKGHTTKCTEDKINFTLEFMPDVVESMNDVELTKLLKLQKTIGCTNMHLYNSKLIITKYESPNDILREFFDVRMDYYQRRYDYLLKSYEDKHFKLNARATFILAFVEKRIELRNKSTEEITAQLEKIELPKIDDSYEYYLTSINLKSLTMEKVAELKKQVGDIENEIKILKSKTLKDLYLEDLKNLEECLA